MPSLPYPGPADRPYQRPCPVCFTPHWSATPAPGASYCSSSCAAIAAAEDRQLASLGWDPSDVTESTKVRLLQQQGTHARQPAPDPSPALGSLNGALYEAQERQKAAGIAALLQQND